MMTFALGLLFPCHFDFVMVCVLTRISSNFIRSRDKTCRKCFVINLIRNESERAVAAGMVGSGWSVAAECWRPEYLA